MLQSASNSLGPGNKLHSLHYSCHCVSFCFFSPLYSTSSSSPPSFIRHSLILFPSTSHRSLSMRHNELRCVDGPLYVCVCVCVCVWGLDWTHSWRGGE